MTSSSLIKHASHGLKSRTMRDYLRMRFAKAAPAAGRVALDVGSATKAAAKNFHVQAIASGAALGHLAKRANPEDSKEMKKHRSNTALGAGYSGVIGARTAKFGSEIRSKANAMAGTKMPPTAAGMKYAKNLHRFGGKVVIAGGLLGANAAYKAHRAFTMKEKQKLAASFDASMVLSHDAELRLDRAFANRQPSIGNRVDNAHTTASQRGNQATNAIGGAAALGAGSKLMHKAPITAAVRATLKGGGIKSAAMKLGMRSRGIAGVAAVGAGLHLLNKARKPITASHDEPLQLSTYAEAAIHSGVAAGLLGIAGLGIAAHLHAHLRHRRALKEDNAKPNEWTHYSGANHKKVDSVNEKLRHGHSTGDYSHPLVVSMLKYHGENLNHYGMDHDGKRQSMATSFDPIELSMSNSMMGRVASAPFRAAKAVAKTAVKVPIAATHPIAYHLGKRAGRRAEMGGKETFVSGGVVRTGAKLAALSGSVTPIGAASYAIGARAGKRQVQANGNDVFKARGGKKHSLKGGLNF